MRGTAPYWHPYWYRLQFRAEREYEWRPMGPGPLSAVPAKALKSQTLQDWACWFLAEAADELNDLRGDLLVECYQEPAPVDGTPPVYSREVSLVGPG
ncbi:hypothetical protein [Kitasatospora sp. MAP5-34]|uniref:hypothetical protein n=1 Tax=Kitasatospora sp. MAP5-34 TaxID=3035102 RepID=UPI0024751854|nr:hypothetical protein [Kitasatospora sp. MAP5-34]MDH6576094.1 hypothetical protein [Kitasatospora sp. MAP5-34]